MADLLPIRQTRTQILAALLTLAGSWYAMMAVHEAGHCLGAILTGGRVETIEFPLAGFSRTTTSGGGHPLAVAWSGPAFGSVAPLLLLPLMRRLPRRPRHIIQFFAGFCLLANGAYIGAGALIRAGDCRQLLQHGSPLWLLPAFGLTASAAGLYLWHRMGAVRGWFSNSACCSTADVHSSDPIT